MELKSGLYADYTEELLDEKEYLQLNREYSQRIEKLKIQADEYRQAASQYESAEKTVAQLKAEMLRFKGKRKLTQEMVDLFVAQVRIYENKNLEIVLNYEDELKKFAETEYGKRGRIMAEKRKLAFYIRLSDADEEVKAGTKDESNSITGQRKLLYAYIKEKQRNLQVLRYWNTLMTDIREQCSITEQNSKGSYRTQSLEDLNVS